MNLRFLWIAIFTFTSAHGVAHAGFIYNFRFTTSAELGNTGVDGAVSGYFSVDDSTNGIISNVSDALKIRELVVTSDTSGTGFAPIGKNLLTYTDSSLGITGWQLLAYNSFVADGTTATGQLIFAASDGVSSGGWMPGLTIGIYPGDDRVGIISWNPDMGKNLGRHKVAAGALRAGDTFTISAAPNPVPEPASLAMWGIGALGAMYAHRKRQQEKKDV